jgi:hypothetical protein
MTEDRAPAIAHVLSEMELLLAMFEAERPVDIVEFNQQIRQVRQAISELCAARRDQ